MSTWETKEIVSLYGWNNADLVEPLKSHSSPLQQPANREHMKKASPTSQQRLNAVAYPFMFSCVECANDQRGVQYILMDL